MSTIRKKAYPSFVLDPTPLMIDAPKGKIRKGTWSLSRLNRLASASDRDVSLMSGITKS